MIAYIEGRLELVTEQAIVVVTDGGVGYEIEIPSRTRQALPGRGGRVALYTMLMVREDMMRLCGFSSWEERETFALLVSIPKVGPRLGIGILSVFRPEDLRAMVAKGDGSMLTQVSGIGKRMAETVFRELCYKLKCEPGSAGIGGAGLPGSVYRAVVDGLKGLGYTEGECAHVVQELLRDDPGLDVPSALHAALRALGRKA